MGMVIYNNTAAMFALNENKKNEKGLAKTLKQAASGMKLNAAGDDASGYSISEKMRVKIRVLNQCRENSVKGQDMIDTASAAVDQQVNLMKQVKTIALRATDDTYNDTDRETLQKEISQLLDESEDIANTQYNGISLLNRRELSRVVKWFDADAPYRVNINNRPVINQAASSDYKVPAGIYRDIDASTVLYDPNTPIAGSDLTAMPSNSRWVWDKTANAPAQIVFDSSDKSYHIGSKTGALVEIAGLANPPGSTAATATNVAVVELQQLTGLPNVGDYVSNTSNYPAYTDGQGNKGYEVKQDIFTGSLSYFDTSRTSSYITELNLSGLAGAVANVPQDLDGLGFSLNCGGCDQFVTIMFDASTSDTKRYEGSTGSPPPLCYVIGVSNVTTTPSLEASLGEAIFNGINAATLDKKGKSLPSTTDTKTTITSKHDIQLTYYAATGKIALTKTGPSITLMNGLMGEMKETDGYKPEQGLYLQTADKGSQHTKITLPNTTLKALFPNAKDGWDIYPEEEDYPTSWPSGYETLSEAEKRQKWKDEVWQYPSRNVNLDMKSCVTTREKANEFLDNVDQAIKYLLNANTTLGAQSSRLDYTKDNLVVMHETATNSESVIRDADMARTMMEYAKYNILSQASQSMLAQANQSPQGVLSLLQ